MKDSQKSVKAGLMIFIATLMIIVISALCISCELSELAPNVVTPNEDDPKITTKENNPIHTTKAPVTTIPVTEPPRPPEFQNPLTGLEASKEVSRTRPISICIGNTASSLPQMGLSAADILVEAPVEGGITRLMLISCSYADSQIFGSVRSTRPYLAYVADQFDAVQAYAGTTDLGKSVSLKEYDTMDYIIQNMSEVYFSDPTRNSPHHIMTDGKKLFSGLVSLGLRATYSKSTLPFEFVEYFSSAPLSKNDSFYVRIPFSSAQTAEFKYNATTKTYDRYQFGSIHSDSANGKALSFENLFLLFCDTTTYDRATGTEISVDVESGGTGYYISNGKYMDIIWHRDENSSLKFTDKNGNSLKVNRGKSYIALIRVSSKNSVVLNAN
jgi:hypothetical protein